MLVKNTGEAFGYCSYKFKLFLERVGLWLTTSVGIMAGEIMNRKFEVILKGDC